MQHRIRAGILIFNDNDELLLIEHEEEQTWWATPGGGLEGNESLHDAVHREVHEETGLTVEIGDIIYINHYHHNNNAVSIVFHATNYDGTPHLNNLTDDEDLVTGYAWLTHDAIRTKSTRPAYLKDELWDDKQRGFPNVRYLHNGKPEDF
jgi:ADP-ribose pyrophosphatase YjhB (NUDIX family)